MKQKSKVHFKDIYFHSWMGLLTKVGSNNATNLKIGGVQVNTIKIQSLDNSFAGHVKIYLYPPWFSP